MEEEGVVPPGSCPEAKLRTERDFPWSGMPGAERDGAVVPVPHGLAEPRGSPAAGPCPARGVTVAREPRAGTRVLRGPVLGICHRPQEAPDGSREVATR